MGRTTARPAGPTRSTCGPPDPSAGASATWRPGVNSGTSVIVPSGGLPGSFNPVAPLLIDSGLDNVGYFLGNDPQITGAITVDVTSSWDNVAAVYAFNGVFGSDPEIVAFNDDTSGTNARVTFTPVVGVRYQVVVTPYTDSSTGGTYSLRAAYGGSPFAEAVPLDGTGDGSVAVANLAANGDARTFSFTTPSNLGSLGSTISLANSNGDGDVYLFDAAGNQIGGDSTGGTGTETITTSGLVANATYFVTVIPELYAAPLTAATLSINLATVSAPLVLTGTAGVANTFYLRRNAGGSFLDVWQNSAQPGFGPPNQAVLVAGVSQINVTGAGLADTLTVDLSAGPLTAPGGGVTFDGAGGTDAVTVVATDGNNAVSVAPAGVTVDGVTVSVASVEQLRLDPRGGTDSLAVAAGGAATLVAAAPGGGVLGRTFSTVSVASGGSLAVAAPASAGDRTVVVTSTLTLGGKLDLAANDMIVRNGNLAALTAAVSTGFAAGGWTGPGIGSTSAAADPRHTTAVGVVQNVTAPGGPTPLYATFDGRPVATTDVLLRYTLYGDVNLDGVVNAADYTRLDGGYVNHLTGWFNGDVNYDGVVDGSDYALTDNAFNQQSGGIAAPAAVVAGVTPTAPQVSTADAPVLPPAPTAVPKPSPFADVAPIVAPTAAATSTPFASYPWPGLDAGAFSHDRDADELALLN